MSGRPMPLTLLLMKRTTIKDIARYLDVSISTVSRALADDRNIRPETKRRVSDAADKLGYKRNRIAANLRRGRTNTVGVVVREMLTPFAAQVLSGIQSVLHQHGINVFVADSAGDCDQERHNVEMMDNAVVDGIIVWLCRTDANTDLYERLRQEGMPMVFFSCPPYDDALPHVVVNDYDKAFFLLENLLRAGRRRIAHLRGDEHVRTFRDVYHAYLDALAKYAVPFDRDLVIDTADSIEAGRDAVLSLHKRGVEFDTVFACTDLTAIGAMNCLHALGIAVPQKVSVAGYAGSPLSSMVYPELTTVEPPLGEMGRTAAGMLLDILSDPHEASRRVVVDAQIKLRGSTHPVTATVHN